MPSSTDAAAAAARSAAQTLYHGTPQRGLTELRAGSPNLGPAGVYGADNLDWAALYALAQDRKGTAVVGGPEPRLLTLKRNKLAPEGSVYEYAAESPGAPPAEDINRGWHVPGNVTPMREHIVKLVDHMKNIEQFDDKDALQNTLGGVAQASCESRRAETSRTGARDPAPGAPATHCRPC
jgi:hypothetical protein